MIHFRQNLHGGHGKKGTMPSRRRVLVATILAVPLALAATSTFAQSSVDYTKVSPSDLVAKTPKKKLVNPYKDSQAAIVAAGSMLFRSYSCSGCHGGNGGGGICPPLTNGVWIYGGSDDTLFRLVTLGSDELQKQGYFRKGLENVVAPMPPFGTTIKSADELWKILTFVRSKFDGDPKYKFGNPPDPASP
jgi:mono/diheme cytochrome c family protein